MCPLTPQLQLSRDIEDCLVAQNLRGMAQVQKALQPGYVYRAAKQLFAAQEQILIATGFPVAGTFETDGPVGAMALYQVLTTLGKEVKLICADPLYRKIAEDYNCMPLPLNDVVGAHQQAQAYYHHHRVSCVLAIERPGLNARGRYTNMRGEDISSGCASFDPYMTLAPCPTLAIGDGGNEIGMGKVSEALEQLAITPSVTSCDELVVADVSNWGAYGLIAFLGLWQQQDLLGDIDSPALLRYCSELGSVDGVTLRNELTEDSLDASHGQGIINQLRQLTGFLPQENEETP